NPLSATTATPRSAPRPPSSPPPASRHSHTSHTSNPLRLNHTTPHAASRRRHTPNSPSPPPAAMPSSAAAIPDFPQRFHAAYPASAIIGATNIASAKPPAALSCIISPDPVPSSASSLPVICP